MWNLATNNIFEEETTADAICITTNGCVKSDGKAVMGAGIAKQARDRYVGCDITLGNKLRKFGNKVCLIATPSEKAMVVALPTKDDWRDNSSLTLIERSLEELVLLTEFFEMTNVHLPMPGVGMGGLSKDSVIPLLNKHLDERFTVHYMGR